MITFELDKVNSLLWLGNYIPYQGKLRKKSHNIYLSFKIIINMVALTEIYKKKEKRKHCKYSIYVSKI